MTIETPDAADKTAIKQLLAECDLPFEDITTQHLKHFIVCRDGAALRGVAGLEVYCENALLRSLAVAKSHRGRGIASELVKKLESNARSLGVAHVYLLTTTAEGFFSKAGYVRIDRSAAPRAIQETTEFKVICPASAVCMVKKL